MMLARADSPSGALSARVAWFLVVAVPLAIVFAGWRWSPPLLNPDSAMGFYAWEAREAGGPWNSYREIDDSDISRDQYIFLTWWSPGQYQIPGIFREFGFSWGHVILLSTLACAWVAAVGSYGLAREFGVSPDASAWFAAVSTLQWHTLFSFGHFRGGDVVIGAFAPWALWLAWRVRQRSAWYLASIPLLLAGGLYLKLSAILFIAPVIAAAGLSNLIHLRGRPLVLMGWGLAAAALGLATWYLIQSQFLARGPNPGETGEGRGVFGPVMFAVLSPWLAATGANNLVGRVLWWLGQDGEAFWLESGWVAALLAVVAWAGAGRWLFRSVPVQVRRAFLVVLGLSILVYASFFFRGSPIGIDDRYMRQTATLLLLALAFVLDDPARSRRRIAAVAMVLIAAFGVASAAQRSALIARLQGRGAEDITQQQMTAPVLARLAALDAAGAPRSTLIYVPEPQAGIEIRRQRALITDDSSIERRRRWQGRVPLVVLAMPEAMERDGRAERVRSQFVDYRTDEWRSEQVDNWWFWTARTE